MKTFLFLVWAVALGEWTIDYLVLPVLLYGEPILFIALSILAIALVWMVRKPARQ